MRRPCLCCYAGSMNKVLTAIVMLIAAAILLATAATVLQRRSPASSETGQAGVVRYENAEYGIRFEYPEGLYLKEVEAGGSGRLQLALVLVEDTQENRDVLGGKVTEPREGPPGITIDAYANPDRLDAEAWVRQDTNWTVATSSSTPAQVAGEEGVTFGWSGLYEGRSVVVAKGDRAYVLAVTWMDVDDRIVGDFGAILSSLELDP